jgi:hypothetical protein
MDLLRVEPHGGFGGLESACRRRSGSPDNQAGGFAAFESQDGKTVYYAKGLDFDGLWSVPVNGGHEAPVLDFPKGSFWGYWALVKTGIYYVNTETGAEPALQFPGLPTNGWCMLPGWTEDRSRFSLAWQCLPTRG